MAKKVNPLICICAAAALVYIFFAALPLSKELHFTTQWTVDCTKDSPEETTPSEEDLIPFKLGQTAGYFTKEGTVKSVFTFPYKAAVSAYDRAVYGTNDDSIEIISNLGKSKGFIKQSGFPFFQENRKYLMLPGGQSFSALSDTGEVLWTFENYVPVTAFSSSDGGTIAGYADGSVYIFDNNGTVSQNYMPSGSDYQVILGAALSKDGSLSACVCGQEKQRFILAKKEKGHSPVIYNEYLEKQTNRQVLIKFSMDESRCYFAHKDALGIVNIRQRKSKHIPVKGTILSIQETAGTKNVFILSHDKERYYVSVLENQDIYSGNFSFTADSAFITVKDDSLFVGKNSTISRIDISKK